MVVAESGLLISLDGIHKYFTLPETLDAVPCKVAKVLVHIIVSRPALANGLCNTFIVTVSVPTQTADLAITMYVVVSNGLAMGVGVAAKFKLVEGLQLKLLAGELVLTDNMTEVPKHMVLSAPAFIFILQLLLSFIIILNAPPCTLINVLLGW